MVTEYIMVATKDGKSTFVRLEASGEGKINVSAGETPSVFSSSSLRVLEDLAYKVSLCVPEGFNVELYKCETPYPDQPFNVIDVFQLGQGSEVPS